MSGSDLGILRPVPGSRKDRKRLGRGPGSGQGQTAGRGTKGSRSRSRGRMPPWFEGGQMPLVRRLPKRGFKNPFRKEYALVKVADLSRFQPSSVVDPQALRSLGLIGKRDKLVKILGDGELGHSLTVKVHKISRQARRKIEAAGGTCQEMET